MSQANAWTGKDRSEMPQVDLKSVEELLELSGIGYEKIDLDPFELKPTQSEIDDDKVSRMRDEIVYNTKTIEDKEFPPIIVSMDMMILDGHHRWAAVRRAGLRRITTLKLDLPWQEGLAWLKGI